MYVFLLLGYLNLDDTNQGPYPRRPVVDDLVDHYLWTGPDDRTGLTITPITVWLCSQAASPELGTLTVEDLMTLTDLMIKLVLTTVGP